MGNAGVGGAGEGGITEGRVVFVARGDGNVGFEEVWVTRGAVKTTEGVFVRVGDGWDAASSRGVWGGLLRSRRSELTTQRLRTPSTNRRMHPPAPHQVKGLKRIRCGRDSIGFLTERSRLCVGRSEVGNRCFIYSATYSEAVIRESIRELEFAWGLGEGGWGASAGVSGKWRVCSRASINA